MAAAPAVPMLMRRGSVERRCLLRPAGTECEAFQGNDTSQHDQKHGEQRTNPRQSAVEGVPEWLEARHATQISFTCVPTLASS